MTKRPRYLGYHIKIVQLAKAVKAIALKLFAISSSGRRDANASDSKGNNYGLIEK